jgi:hypothetical protein
MKKPILPAPVRSTLGKLADDIDKINARQKQIQARLGTIGAESAKLHAEMQGNDVRRAKLQREFDAASNA